MGNFRLAYHANCWGPLGGNAVGVTSIAQLTYRTFGDMPTAIREIAEAGYAGVELFDGNLLDYEDRLTELAAMLQASRLQLVAAYSGANFIFEDVLTEELARIERVAEAAAATAAEHLVVGGGARRAGAEQNRAERSNRWADGEGFHSGALREWGWNHRLLYIEAVIGQMLRDREPPFAMRGGRRRERTAPKPRQGRKRPT